MLFDFLIHSVNLADTKSTACIEPRLLNPKPKPNKIVPISMEHLQIAYDLLVIMIGLAALSIVVFWASRTGESDLRDFSILYLCFTLVLIVVVSKKYLSINVADYSARTWYWLSGLELILNHAVIVAGIHFFAGVYQLRYRKAITTGFLLIMLLSAGLLLSS